MRTLILLSFAFVAPAFAQRELAGSADIHQSLRRLNTLGSVLMIAAHPDDENTNVLAYFARGRLVRTGYLALTRGEGGQNLIGAEQGDYMGLIRTQELVAARRVDGGEQFFTRAIDFGYSKNADETLAKWGRDQVLADVVWVIRNYRPDVILLRFSGTPRDGHGHHQSSAILAKDAFAAAADPARFPEQLKFVKPWQARRVLFNAFVFTPEQEKELARLPNRVELDAGEFNPVLGLSYNQIAGMSRTRHASQGFGSPEQPGTNRNTFTLVAGEPASKDVLDGVDTTWNRLPGGAAIQAVLNDAIRTFDLQHPERTIPLLGRARPLIAAIDHPDARRKLRELDDTIVKCAGLYLDASAARFSVTPGSAIPIQIKAVNRGAAKVELTRVEFEGLAGTTAVDVNAPVTNTPSQPRAEWKVPADAPYTQPFWLRNPKKGVLYGIENQAGIGPADNPPVLTAIFRLKIGGEDVTAVRPVHYRYVDSVRGELVRPLIVVPPVAVEIAEPVLVFGTAAARNVDVLLKANQPDFRGSVKLRAPAGWTVAPAERPFELARLGEQTTVRFEVRPPAGDAIAELEAIAMSGGREYSHAMRTVDYPHIPPRTAFPPARAKLVRASIQTLSRSVGYVMGPGDEMPESLRQIGIQVTLLGDADLAGGDLSRFDAVVTGVRAFNTRPVLRANFQRLLDFASRGGTLVVQYNTIEGLPGRENRDAVSRLGPYPIQISRDRVAVEEAPVNMPNPEHALLRTPNAISAKDFEGWVQERGLYFAKEFDSRYQSLFASHDPGEEWLPGGMLYTRHGKGAYVFTSYAWFRQLPAGVPGAYRIFANLISAGKAVK